MAYNELVSLGGNGIIDILTDDANATASQILSGYTAYVKGKKVTGNIPSQGAQTITPGTTNKTIASGKYLSGTQTIKGDSNLVAGNIKKGTSIFGVSGTFTSDANATAANILSGKTAYVNGSKITGSMANRGNITNAVSSIFVEGGSAGTGLYVRISQGAYLTNTSSGYPEVFLPYNKIDPYRGQWQNTGGIGSGTDYVALNSIPNGFYYSQGASWAPEIRVNKNQLKDYVGAVKSLNCNKSGSKSVGSGNTAEVLFSINVSGYNLALIKGRVESNGTNSSYGEFVAGSQTAKRCIGYYGNYEGKCAIFLNGQSGNINIGGRSVSTSGSSGYGVACRIDSIYLYNVPGL